MLQTIAEKDSSNKVNTKRKKPEKNVYSDHCHELVTKRTFKNQKKETRNHSLYYKENMEFALPKSSLDFEEHENGFGNDYGYEDDADDESTFLSQDEEAEDEEVSGNFVVEDEVAPVTFEV